MRLEDDPIAKSIEQLINKAGEPMETAEVVKALQARKPELTRDLVLYRLRLLAAAQRLHGKSVGPGKGCWIWWVD